MENTSVLKIPEDWTVAIYRWKELTTEKGSVWNELKKLVSQDPGTGVFEDLRNDLEEWKLFINEMEQQAMLPEGIYQWKTVSNLLNLAEKAAVQSAIHDQTLDRINFADLTAKDWDAFCWLRGFSRETLPGTRRANGNQGGRRDIPYPYRG